MGIRIGDKFGRLTVESLGRLQGRNRYWFCLCECGTRKEIYGSSLTRGASKSCGCLSAELSSARRKTHGKTRTPEHVIWLGMRQRCNDKNHPAYKNYGGRGIKVCERWDSFESFLADMGQAKGRMIERQDNNKDYEPGNCIWADAKTQANNRRSNRTYEYKGQTKNIQQWAETKNIPYFTLRARLVILGWPIKRALNEPIRKKPKE